MSRKARFLLRFRRANQKKTSNNSNVSSSFEKLDAFRTELDLLVRALKDEHEALTRVRESRLKVSKRIIALSKASSFVEGDRFKPSLRSFETRQEDISLAHQEYEEQFQEHVIDNVVQWEHLIRTGIKAAKKNFYSTERQKGHYEQKILRLERAALKSKYSSDTEKKKYDELVVKLKRNNKKLDAVVKEYSSLASNIKHLATAVVDQGWKDIDSLVNTVSQFDKRLGGDESSFFNNSTLGSFGVQHLDRWKELEWRIAAASTSSFSRSSFSNETECSSVNNDYSCTSVESPVSQATTQTEPISERKYCKESIQDGVTKGDGAVAHKNKCDGVPIHYSNILLGIIVNVQN